MKLFFEEYAYPLDLLRKNFANEDSFSYLQDGDLAKLPWVGYFFNSEINDIVFILPKVFISENKKAFNRYDPTEITDLSPEDNPLKNNADDEVVFELSAWLYQAIRHFYERNTQSEIGSDVQIQYIKPFGEKVSKTIIESILSLREFQRKHYNLFTYISLVNSSGNNKVQWNKTISKEHPVFKDGKPYYMRFRNKNKMVNFDETLLSLFYSVLNYLSQSYHFKYQLVQGYTILMPAKIQSLIESGKGTRLLKKIRHNYFTDELVTLWNLLFEFFVRAEQIASGKSIHERLLVSNFNLVFEDMVDQLISDNRKEVPQELWNQLDGKVVDHIYRDRSIVEEDRMVYFIGDSKYYKETTGLGQNSIYKQFTYAKNVIQYNINLFNECHNDSVFRYRDSLTEGYNITPNFFIRGSIDFNNPRSQVQNISKDQSMEKHNEHFANRLFDRDTLFLQSYNINFMFVVASYVNNSDDIALKKSIQSMFRNDFLEYINKRYEFSILVPKRGDLSEAVERNFKKLLGKIYQPAEVDNLLIMALDKGEAFQSENNQLVLEIEKDFNIYDYQLGTNPERVSKMVQYRYWETPTPMAAEGDEAIEDYRRNSEKIAKYTQHQQKTVLFGIYKDAEHLKWITDNRKYNVRLGKRAGAVKRTQQVTSAQYLVLYEFRNAKHYKVYRLNDKHFIWDVKKMLETGYPLKDKKDNNCYYIYDIIKETDELGSLNIEVILNQKHKQFTEDTGSQIVEGTPIYVYENEL